MSPNNRKAPHGRIDGLDGWRTLAVLFMVIYHFLWDLKAFGALPGLDMNALPMLLWRDGTGCSFVLLAGISCRFSRSNLRRGIRTLACAALVTLFSALAGAVIWFGALHLLGCGMVLYALAGKALEKLPPDALAAGALVLFLLTWPVMERVRVTVPGLWILGLRTAAFSSADYYPLIPWLFLFLAGTAVGGRILTDAVPWKTRRLPPALLWPGRNALWIYMLHQPVLLALARIIAG